MPIGESLCNIAARLCLLSAVMSANDDDDEELSAVDAAEYIGRSPGALAQDRHYRQGPAYRKASNRRVFYRRSVLDAWLAEHDAAA